MNVQLFPADCLQPCGGSDCGSAVRKTDCMASVTTWTLGRKTSISRENQEKKSVQISTKMRTLHLGSSTVECFMCFFVTNLRSDLEPCTSMAMTDPRSTDQYFFSLRLTGKP